jgi:chromosome segregation ATPase
MSDAEKNQNDITTSLRTYERNELIDKVIDKHKRLLNEHNSQFSEIDGKIRSLNEHITSCKDKKEHVATRTEVLTEKRQLFYHQAEKLLDELMSAYGSNPAAQKELRDVLEAFPKVKSALSPEDENKLVGPIFANISLVSSNLPKAQGPIDSFRARIADAMAANIELSSLKAPDEDFDKGGADYEKELGELNLKYKWIVNRISSHKEALAHWEKALACPADEEEVKT